MKGLSVVLPVQSHMFGGRVMMKTSWQESERVDGETRMEEVKGGGEREDVEGWI